MTFDDAQQLLLDNVTDEETRPLVVYVMSVLKDTYAPTIEMTTTEYEIFKGAKVDEDSADWLDDISWGKVDYNYPKFMQAWLRPECVKVVDDERN